MGNVLLGRPAIHVDVTLICISYLRIVANVVHPFIEKIFPVDSFSKIMCLATKQKWFRNGLFEEHNNKFVLLT